MRLTDRDKDIIEAVYRYRILRQDQIQRLFFGTAAAAQRVLVRLYDHTFLERKFLPVYEGRSPTLYVLDKRGAELLRAERGYE
ncbi:MAG: replication-relaxation family protein, partial [Anaerolineae bacterium]|nr:replication-relaxation family protein [Anaerolineae bacterium]